LLLGVAIRVCMVKITTSVTRQPRTIAAAYRRIIAFL